MHFDFRLASIRTLIHRWIGVLLVGVAFSVGLSSHESSQLLSAAEDWPMWRYSPDRSACSPNTLPTELAELWKLSFPERVTAWDDPLNQDLMSYDRNFEPIALDGKILIGFNDQDKLCAIDARTGETVWTFFAEAPIRLAPAGWQDRVFVCSDDGYLYCLKVASGELLWKFRGAPNAQHALGNRRLTSAWPARGGPVVRDGVVYFAASIWPFMGTFIYALEAESGKVVWVNDSTGAQYIKQPHSAPSFAGVGPQGALVATEGQLIVPGGRSVPAVFDRQNGAFKYFEINAGGKGTGGSFVAADSKQFFVHTRLNGTRAFNISTGKKTAFMPGEPVLCGDHLFASHEIKNQRFISCYPANVETEENREPLWSIEVNATDDLIAAGEFLVASGSNKITIVRRPTLVEGSWKNGEVVKQIQTGEKIARLLVADQRLIAAAQSGAIYCYGSPGQPTRSNDAATPTIATTAGEQTPEAALARESAEKTVAQWLRAGTAEGYAFWFGPCEADLLEAFVKLSPFVQLAIVDTDAQRVDAMRKHLDRLGAHGKITAHVGSPKSFLPPQYVAQMVFVSNPSVAKPSDDDWKTAYSSVRPYGGRMLVVNEGENKNRWTRRLKKLQLAQAEVSSKQWGVLVKREGPLPGASDWTHQYGDVANTLKSDDSRLKLPLGILWFGGSSNTDVLPRHGHGPPQQVVAGRLYIEGMNSLSARDVYTGRVLWQRQFKDLGTNDVYFDDTYDDKPLDTKYNQVHIPGANARGTNFVVTEDSIYLIVADHCLILDAITGKDKGKIALPKNASGESPEWGYIGVYKDVLLGGVGFANYKRRNSLEFESDALLALTKSGFGSKSLDRAASRALIAFDRHTGQQLWRVDAIHSFWHNGIVAGGDRVYCLDRNPAMVDEALRRRGIRKADSFRVVALNYKSGERLWESSENITGTWLGYSQQFDSLLLAGAQASDRLVDEVGKGMRVYDAKDGSIRWSKDKLSYNGPCILHNNWIITNTNAYAQSAGAFDIRTGEQLMTSNPLTGEEQPWKVARAYGCNNIIASENMLTFRSGAASYCDLLSDSGTGNLGGFKSGCTSNLVVAGGVLNAPDYTRTCSCAYQNQTSLALVHMPGLDTWTVSAAAVNAAENQVIQNIAINLGAPGDRSDESHQLWLDYPAVGGDSPQFDIEMNEDVKYFQQHSSTFEKTELPWIYASGATNIRQLRLGLRTQKTVPTVVKSSSDDDDEKKAAATKAAAEKEKEKVTTAVKDDKPAKDEKADTKTSTEPETPKIVEIFKDPFPARKYDLQLYFSLPLAMQNQAHEFVVSVAGANSQTVILGGEGAKRLTKTITFNDLILDRELKLEFVSKRGQTVLSGLRLTSE
jgi:outer membrane protein assembly factor BamB